jgi:hypothetical protein
MKARTVIRDFPPVKSEAPPMPPVSRPAVTIGRLVNYVLQDGQIRPLLVVRVWGDVPINGYVNGILYFDGSNDARVLPHEHPNPAGMPMQWVTSIHYDAEKKPGTWHWPERI